MKLQRYDIEQDGFDINVSLIAKASDTGTWVKASDAEALEKRVLELEKALVQISLRTNSSWIEQFCERTLGEKK
jgi:hypothetical protein